MNKGAIKNNLKINEKTTKEKVDIKVPRNKLSHLSKTPRGTKLGMKILDNHVKLKIN
jgi:hypothetical protein